MTNERRVILDLSWPCGSSVNNGIPSGYFLGELLELSYPTIDAFVLAIVFLSLGLSAVLFSFLQVSSRYSQSALKAVFSGRNNFQPTLFVCTLLVPSTLATINLHSNLVCGVVIKGHETYTLIAVSSLKIVGDMSFRHEL